MSAAAAAAAVAPAVGQQGAKIVSLEGEMKITSWADAEAESKMPVVVGKSGGIYGSDSSFDKLGLPEQVYKNVLCGLQFTTPSKIQAEALPVILGPNKPNFIGQAQAGSGKTAAYGLAIMTLVDKDKKTVQAICLVPTREIANQVHEVLSKLAKDTGITVKKAVPDEPKGRVIDQVVIGTPGTMLAKLKHREINPSTIILFVCDEADRMIVQHGGLGEQTMQIKKQCSNKALQVLLFSATFPDYVQRFANAIAPKAVSVRIKKEDLSLDHVKQFWVETLAGDPSDKYQKLMKLYGLLQIGQSLIFVETIKNAKELTNQLRKDGYSVSLIYGKDMKTTERDTIMSDFATGKTTVLVTTNVLARGVDVPAVNLVINYDLPMIRLKNNAPKPDYETYCHRIGRSGRFGRQGAAINFVTNAEEKQTIGSIAKFFQRPVTQLSFDDFKALEHTIKQHLQNPT